MLTWVGHNLKNIDVDVPLGERLHGMEEVVGSSPIRSTILKAMV